MKKFKLFFLLVVVFGFAKGLFAGDPAQLIKEGDDLFFQGGEVYCLVEATCINLYSQAIDKYKEAIKVDPKNYDAYWKLSRAYRQYGDEFQMRNAPNWKDTTAKYGKLGMAAAQKAIDLDDKRVEGWLLFGLNVGLYSDAVSILTALREGLKGKTEKALGNAYKIDKNFMDGRPIIAWGRFWAVLPWPLAKVSKGVKILEEGLRTHGAGKWGSGGSYDFQRLLAEALIRDGGSKNKARAKKLLEETINNCKIKHHVNKAKEVLDDL